MEWTMEQRKAFAQLLREARERKGLNQGEVAQRLKLSPGTLSQMERVAFDGMRWLDVVKLARFYGISLDEVATLLGQPPADPPEVHSSRLRGLVGALDATPEPNKQFLLDVLDTLLKGLRA